jgi:hypothetical protein
MLYKRSRRSVRRLASMARPRLTSSAARRQPHHDHDRERDVPAQHTTSNGKYRRGRRTAASLPVVFVGAKNGSRGPVEIGEMCPHLQGQVRSEIRPRRAEQRFASDGHPPSVVRRSWPRLSRREELAVGEAFGILSRPAVTLRVRFFGTIPFVLRKVLKGANRCLSLNVDSETVSRGTWIRSCKPASRR